MKASPRATAIAVGKSRYHGRPCRYPGHGTERKTANGECVVCWRKRKKKQASHRHGRRRRHAEVKGHAPPPPEHLCPPKPEDGRCEYCGSDLGPLCLDHDHETGLFRGWLCHKCNLADVLQGIDIAGPVVVNDPGASPEAPPCPNSTMTGS